jgi:hypothetical protein
MPGRIRIYLVLVGGIAVGSRLQNPCAQRHDRLVGRVDVVDPEVKVNLLLRSSVWPVRWDMVGRELDTHPRFTVDQHHVPLVLSIDHAAKHSRPELAFAGQIGGVEHNNLVVDFHRVMIAPSADDDQFLDCRRFGAKPQHGPADTTGRVHVHTISPSVAGGFAASLRQAWMTPTAPSWSPPGCPQLPSASRDGNEYILIQHCRNWALRRHSDKPPTTALRRRGHTPHPVDLPTDRAALLVCRLVNEGGLQRICNRTPDHTSGHGLCARLPADVLIVSRVILASRSEKPWTRLSPA